MAKHKANFFQRPMGLSFVSLLTLVGVVLSGLVSIPAAKAVNPTWTTLNGTGVTTLADGTTAQVALTGTNPSTATNNHYYEGGGFSFFGMKYELHKDGDMVTANFAGGPNGGITSMRLLLGWINLHDEVIISTSTDGTTFTPFDMSDPAHVSHMCVALYNCAMAYPTTLTSVGSDLGFFAPNMDAAIAYGGDYMLKFSTAIKAIRVENPALSRPAGSQNGVGFLVTTDLAYLIQTAVNDSTMGTAGVEINDSGNYTLRAFNKTGYQFVNWTCTNSQTATTSTSKVSAITPTADTVCTANFITKPVVTVAISDGAGGSVSGTDTNADGIWDLTVTVTAGWTFNGWTCTNSQSPAHGAYKWTEDVLIATADTVCTANVSNGPPPPNVPAAPTAVAGNTTATVTITPNASGPTPTSYRLTAGPGGQYCDVTPPATSCVVTGLTNGTAYTFTATATNADGTSTASSQSNSATPFAPPTPDTPIAPTAVAGNGRATVTIVPNASGPTPTSYRLTSGPGGFYCDVTPPATSCVVTGLTNGTAYTFTAVARNADGSSSASGVSNSVTPVGSSSGGGHSGGSGSVTPVTPAPVSFFAMKTIPHFKADKSILTVAFKKSIKAFVVKTKPATVYRCTGYITTKNVRRIDRALALVRAKDVCNYIKALKPNAQITVSGVVPIRATGSKNRKVIIRAFS